MVIVYLDDMLLLERNQISLVQVPDTLIFLLQNFGVLINLNELEPFQQIEFIVLHVVLSFLKDAFWSLEISHSNNHETENYLLSGSIKTSLN